MTERSLEESCVSASGSRKIHQITEKAITAKIKNINPKRKKRLFFIFLFFAWNDPMPRIENLHAPGFVKCPPPPRSYARESADSNSQGERIRCMPDIKLTEEELFTGLLPYYFER
uniref:Uncharacterized protein n=1 Tax=Anaerolinea thermolimosa TaxID=229919 RepID=A0A7C4KIA1_9CHLR